MQNDTPCIDSMSTPVDIAVSTLAFSEKPVKLDWAKLNDSFRNISVEPIRLANAIYQGRPFCPLMRGRRSIENFMAAQHIGVDLDAGDHRSSLDAIVNNEQWKRYSALAYETPSNTKDNPRSRVVFFLQSPITNANEYRAAIDTMTALFEGADPACVDPARFFYGNGNLRGGGSTEGIIFNDKPRIGVAELRQLYRQVQGLRATAGKEKAKFYSETGPDIPMPMGEWNPEQVLQTILPNGATGNRNQLGFWFACRLHENGHSRTEAEGWVLKYQSQVSGDQTPAYTREEALKSVASAYR